MDNHPADEFITALSSTIKDYRAKVAASRELDDLLDMSAHMIAALGALRSQQLNTDRGSNARLGS